MRHLEFPEGSFDGLWSSFSLLHIRAIEIEIDKTLSGFISVLRPCASAAVRRHRSSCRPPNSMPAPLDSAYTSEGQPQPIPILRRSRSRRPCRRSSSLLRRRMRGEASRIAVQAFSESEVLTALRNGSGNLELISWRTAPQDFAITRGADSTALPAGTAQEVALNYRPKGTFFRRVQ